MALNSPTWPPGRPARTCEHLEGPGDVEGLDALLSGPSALAFVKGDPVEAARGLRDFAKLHPVLIIKGGVMDGRPLTAAEAADTLPTSAEPDSPRYDARRRRVACCRTASAKLASGTVEPESNWTPTRRPFPRTSRT